MIATAIHTGHAVRPEIARLLALDEATRLREEDPHTGRLAAVVPTHLVALRSRFEVDLNRPRAKAVYLRPQDAWGLEVWRSSPPADVVARSLAEYDAFYAALRELLAEKARRHGRFVVYDLHSYNHRRQGADAAPAEAADNPEVNVGTGSMDRRRWVPVVERLIADLHGVDFLGRRLDVRENVRFRGGELAAWVHREFPASGCAIALEIKKLFMDEWTGAPYGAEVDAVEAALRHAARGTLDELAAW